MPTVNSAVAAALRPGAKHTRTSRALAASRFTLTGPPRHTTTSRRLSAAFSTRSVTGPIWVTRTSAPSSASISSSSASLASVTSATGPKGSSGQPSLTSFVSAARSPSSASTAPAISPGSTKWSPAATTRTGSVLWVIVDLRIVASLSRC